MRRLIVLFLFTASTFGIAVVNAQEEPAVIPMTAGNETDGLSPQEGDPIIGSLVVTTSHDSLIQGSRVEITATLNVVEEASGVYFYVFTGNTGESFLSVETIEVPEGCMDFMDYDQIVCQNLTPTTDITIVISGSVNNVDTIPYVNMTYWWNGLNPQTDARYLTWYGEMAALPYPVYLPSILR